ncbi:IS4 family transposase [Lentzea aerocolonigenes]|uniref:IS4 family transposase n=5 Tax=Lentzea aerocolonigenes TaxID=68170 RepID=UPI0004C36BAF|nr:IS4 family transposase [Lentzea aerocolonigenes]MCP2243198.1 Transposase DDE domain-containing protein [Lentzea aerocolonigenes]
MPSPRSFTDGISIGVLTRLFDRDLVDEVLVETGRREKRSRLLPARVVVYYVLALCLFFGDGYEEVMRKLVNGLRFLGTWRTGWQVPSTSAISQARQRLGEEPLRVLFERVAAPMAQPGTKGAWFHGWRVMAVDGVIVDVPDTADNLEAFGKTGHQDGKSPFPQVRIVGLGECGTHAIVAAAIDSWRVYERELFARVLDDIEPDMVVLADRGFFSYELWCQARQTEAELVWRISDNVDVPVLEWLPDGSYRAELLPKNMKSDLKRGRRRSVPDEARIAVRVVEYMVTNRGGKAETIRLITSIMDHELAPAAELAALYRQRWEFELTLDEVETHQMPHHRLLRSKTPELVRQEIWALLLTHYAVRDLMLEAAEDMDADDGLDVDELSFVRSLNAVRRQVTNQAGFSPSPVEESDSRDD